MDLTDFLQFSCYGINNKAANGHIFRDERMGLNAAKEYREKGVLE